MFFFINFSFDIVINSFEYLLLFRQTMKLSQKRTQFLFYNFIHLSFFLFLCCNCLLICFLFYYS
eukprot:UN11504